MAQRVMNKRNGDMATIVGEFGDHYWLTAEHTAVPWTSPKSFWEEPKPKTGDVWRFGGEGGTEYRVLGVDEVNKVWLIVRKDYYGGGGWPIPTHDGDPVQTEPEIDTSAIYVRRLPDHANLTLVSRQGS